MGMPIVRTRANTLRVIGMLRFYAGMATSLHGRRSRIRFRAKSMSFTRKEAVGVVGAIIPWNAPTAASIWKIGPALATGCTIVLKPSEEAPLTPLADRGLMHEAGVPPGVVNIVTGTGVEAGARLAEHPGVDKIVFTGSTATGQAIIRASAGNLKRVSLELGGKSPVIVCADADLDKAVPVAAMAAFANSGQICIAGSRLLVERTIHDELVERLGRHIAAAPEDRRWCRSVDRDRSARLPAATRQGEGYFAKRTRRGRDRGRRRPAVERRHAMPAAISSSPRCLPASPTRCRIARDEIFGPVISALPFDTLDEAVKRANATQYGLAAGVFTRDVSKAHQSSREASAPDRSG